MAILVLVVGLAGCDASQPDPRADEPVPLYAAASLADVLDALLEEYEAGGVPPVEERYAASGVLAHQIIAGAPQGLFLSASVEWADELERRGLVEEGTRIDFLGNRLVVVVPDGAAFVPADLDDLTAPEIARIALADPDSAPAGDYARQALESAAVWQALTDRVVATVDVRAAVAHVVAGEVDAAVVYATDAEAFELDVAFEVPEALHEPIRYPMLVVHDAPPSTPFLYLWLLGHADAFRDAGFTVLTEGAGAAPPPR